MASRAIRVLLVDDHAMVREGLSVLLSAQPDLTVVGEASNGADALASVPRCKPDVALMDVTMPGMSGIEATRNIVRTAPATRVLGLTVHDDRHYFLRMLAAGASGYILKGATSAELADAIRSVHRGGVYLTPVMARDMVEDYLRYRARSGSAEGNGLTARELDVLRAIGRGLTNQEVADALHVSVNTVQTHRAHIMSKLGLENRHQLIKYAIEKGYMDALG